jgi:hypothetical protein
MEAEKMTHQFGLTKNILLTLWCMLKLVFSTRANQIRKLA